MNEVEKLIENYTIKEPVQEEKKILNENLAKMLDKAKWDAVGVLSGGKYDQFRAKGLVAIYKEDLEKLLGKKISIKEASKNPELDAKLDKLAQASGLNHVGPGETAFDMDEMIYVDVSEMDEREYDRMEKELDKKTIKGKGFNAYGWNDVSGYEYWKRESEDGDYNYINITVAVDPKMIDSVDPRAMKKAAEKLHNYFSKYSKY